MSNIRELLALKAVVPWTHKALAITPVSGTDPTLIYGVELEIEGLGTTVPPTDRTVGGIMAHEDGSLRNNGYEYVTYPMAHRELMYVLHQFFMKNKFTEDNYSERCSTHVHANVQDLTVDQVRTLLVTYMVFERVLFRFIQDDRQNNIFCVPLHETRLSYDMVMAGDAEDWKYKWKSWEKYTALNLLPMYSQGTIEFRHMGGTCDLNRINIWVSVIGCLFAWARNNTLESSLALFSSLNTTSQYVAVLTKVFGSFAGVLMCPTLTSDMEEGVLMLKYGCLKKRTVKQKPEVRFDSTGFFFTNDDAGARADLPEPLNWEALTQQTEEALRAGRLRPPANRGGGTLVGAGQAPQTNAQAELAARRAQADLERQRRLDDIVRRATQLNRI